MTLCLSSDTALPSLCSRADCWGSGQQEDVWDVWSPGHKVLADGPAVLAGSPTSSAVLGEEAGRLVAGCAVELQPCPRVGWRLGREQETCPKLTRKVNVVRVCFHGMQHVSVVPDWLVQVAVSLACCWKLENK